MLEAGLAARTSGGDDVLAELLSHLAVAETMDARAEDALVHAQRARELFAEADDLRGLATAERVLGDAYCEARTASTRRRMRSARARRGRARGQRGGDRRLPAQPRDPRVHAEDLTAAIDCDRRAIAQFDRIGHTSGLAQAYANLGYKLSQAGEYGEALTYCERGIVLAREIGDALAVADVTDTIAAIHLAKGDYAAVERRAEEAAASLSRDRCDPAGGALARHGRRGVRPLGRRGAGPRHPATGPQYGRFACLVEGRAARRGAVGRQLHRSGRGGAPAAAVVARKVADLRR